MIDQGHQSNNWKNETEFRRSFLNRALPFLTERGTEILRRKTVAIAGCGGVGGLAAITLTRMGVGNFHLADPGRFDAPDINRQWGATQKTLGEMKVKVYREWIEAINPYAKVQTWESGVQLDTIEPFLNNCDLLIDCLDLAVLPSVRAAMFEQARKKGAFSITGPVFGFSAIIFCSDPAGMSMAPFVKLLDSTQGDASFPKFLYRIFMPEHLDLLTSWFRETKTKVPSIAVGPLISGSVVATEALNILIFEEIPGGRRPITIPHVIFVDLYGMHYLIMNGEKILKRFENDAT